MLSIRASTSQSKNKTFGRSPRKPKEDNVQWVTRNLPADGRPCLLLLGGSSTSDCRLRIAQSHARNDLTPSYWSHVAILQPAGAKGSTPKVMEISLTPPTGFGFPPLTNGVQAAPLARYASRKDWPNVAIIFLPVAVKDLNYALARFQKQRSALDATELVLEWLAYVWGVGRTGNPLLDGKGIPAAVLVEYVMAGVNYELTPGLDSRSSCPEAIWQSARWWHEYYNKTGTKKLEGCWYIGHTLF